MTPNLSQDIKSCEGLRLRAYPDPESELAKTGKGDGSPWTIGYGHCGLDVHPGLEWTLEQAEASLRADITKAIAGLDKQFPWWRTLNDARQDVLVNMAFNLGIRGLLGFKKMLRAASGGRFDTAATEILNSTFATQTKQRARRLAAQMRTGLRA